MTNIFKRFVSGVVGAESGSRPPAGGEAGLRAGPGTDAEAGPDWLRFVPQDVRGLVASKLPSGLLDGLGAGLFGAAPREPSATPAGAQFLARSFSNAAGSRPYKLFVPSGYAGQPVALVVMLHGCTQSPDDFAAGTGMNRAAEEQVFLVAYPGQTQSANPQKCWNWFKESDQRRDTGEPSLIAGITRQIMAEYAIDPARVYVAGLSAGGAAAAIMGATYPELYAAVGVHSGLACGAARDIASAMDAMRNGAPARAAASGVPTIVFHGDRDTTVNPRNADAVIAQSSAASASRAELRTGRTPNGHAYRCTVARDAAGRVTSEQWMVEGAGHAWSGGSAAGSYTDPRGPDATQEMLRFFREHGRREHSRHEH